MQFANLHSNQKTNLHSLKQNKNTLYLYCRAHFTKNSLQLRQTWLSFFFFICSVKLQQPIKTIVLTISMESLFYISVFGGWSNPEMLFERHKCLALCVSATNSLLSITTRTTPKCLQVICSIQQVRPSNNNLQLGNNQDCTYDKIYLLPRRTSSISFVQITERQTGFAARHRNRPKLSRPCVQSFAHATTT